VWVVNPYPKPRKVSPGTVIGYAEFLEPDDITPVGGDVAVLSTMPSSVNAESDLDPGLRQNPSSTLDMDPLGDNDSPSEGEFLDDEFDSFDACLDFGYQDSEFFVFPDTPALDKAHQQDTSRVASAGGDTVSNQPAWTQLPLDHLTADQVAQLTTMLNNFPGLFSGDKFTVGAVPGVQHRIETTTSDPVCVRQWRLPQVTKEVIRAECDQMLVTHPQKGWLTPFLWFTVLDSRSAYWAISVHPDDRPKTTFTDGKRLFQFCRLPFGLSTAPTFQRTMNIVLASVLGRHTLAYLEDVVIASSSFDGHLQDLQETLGLLEGAGMKLNLEKCEFAKHQVKLLTLDKTNEIRCKV